MLPFHSDSASAGSQAYLLGYVKDYQLTLMSVLHIVPLYISIYIYICTATVYVNAVLCIINQLLFVSNRSSVFLLVCYFVDFVLYIVICLCGICLCGTWHVFV